MFKTECGKFLDTMTSMRSSAINSAVESAIQSEHVPYVEQMTTARDALIAEERQNTAESIRKLQADLDKKVEHFTKETDIAIAENKKRVTEKATAKAKAEYDNFILGVSKLVDETNID